MVVLVAEGSVACICRAAPSLHAAAWLAGMMKNTHRLPDQSSSPKG
jgi:hypothetical protein